MTRYDSTTTWTKRQKQNRRLLFDNVVVHHENCACSMPDGRIDPRCVVACAPDCELPHRCVPIQKEGA
jgi:hypothetical protein